MNEISESIAIYIGHFHPLVVHLPIGFLFFLFFLELIIWKTKNDSLKSVRFYLAGLSMLSSIAAVFLGYLLAMEGGYDAELLEKHEHAGQILAIISIVIFILEWKLKEKAYFERTFQASVLVSVIMLSVVGHYGGSLTHGSEYLSVAQAFEPKGVKAEAIAITDINQAVVYSQIIHPIIERKCVQCHNPDKIKGGLRMDSYELLMEGGDSGEVIVAGNAAGSELVKLIHMEPSEKRAMPPKGKTPLTENEMALIEWWIEQGAAKDKKVADLQANDKIKTILAKYTSGGEAGEESTETALPQVAAAPAKAIEDTKNLGINVIPVSQESNLLDVRCIIGKKEWSDAKTEKLLAIKEQIFTLDLSGTSITSKSLSAISQMPHIETLLLQNTSLSDTGFESLSALKNLKILNLYAVPLTDKSIESLSKINSLKKIYIWKTNISPKGVELLKSKLPNVEVVGVESGKQA